MIEHQNPAASTRTKSSAHVRIRTRRQGDWARYANAIFESADSQGYTHGRIWTDALLCPRGLRILLGDWQENLWKSADKSNIKVWKGNAISSEADVILDLSLRLLFCFLSSFLRSLFLISDSVSFLVVLLILRLFCFKTLISIWFHSLRKLNFHLFNFFHF